MADVLYIGGESLSASARYLHKADVLRATPFAAFGGQEGVIGSGDFKVVEGATPGGFVDVNPGVVAVLGRGSAQAYEMYVAKEEVQTSITLSPTDSSGPRSDLVLMRVVDPEDGPSGDTAPTDTVNGPYAFLEVIEGVDATTATLADTFAVHGVRAGYALARIDRPASTGTITNAEIVNLRRLASPLRETIQQVGHQNALEVVSGAAFVDIPSTGRMTTRVPEWATGMDLDIVCKPMRCRRDDGTGASMFGEAGVRINGAAPSITNWWNKTFSGANSEIWTGVAGFVNVAAYQGQDISLQVVHNVSGGTGTELQALDQTATVFGLQFSQTVE